MEMFAHVFAAIGKYADDELAKRAPATLDSCARTQVVAPLMVLCEKIGSNGIRAHHSHNIIDRDMLGVARRGR